MLEDRAEREGQVALASGLAVAVVAFAFPFSRFVFGYFVTLVHEMGHTLAGWLFGYPSIPALYWRGGRRQRLLQHDGEGSDTRAGRNAGGYSFLSKLLRPH